MTPLRLARYALVLLMLLVVGSVAWTLRRPEPEASPSPGPVATEEPSAKTRMGGLVYRSFKAGEEDFELRAERMRGQETEEVHLEVVDVTFPYAADGERRTARIRAAECLYRPSTEDAEFEGDVVVTTDDGLELRTDSLLYRGSNGLASTDDPVSFSRDALSGTSLGMTLDARRGILVLPREVELRVESEGRSATNLVADHATFYQLSEKAQFDGNVSVGRGADSLRTGRLILWGTRAGLRSLRAALGSDLRLGGGESALPTGGASFDFSGTMRLESQMLDANFREDGGLSDAIASRGARMTFEPGARDEPERRSLKGRILMFDWDEEGRLEQMKGQGEIEAVMQPLAGEDLAPRTVTCRGFLARLVPGGGIRNIEFRKDVVFTREPQRATAGQAEYVGKTGMMRLYEGPRLFDDEQPSQLEAEVMWVTLKTGDLKARHEVRHTFEGLAEDAAGQSSTAPVVIGSDQLEYDAGVGVARYFGRPALLRRGADELRAAEIRLYDTQGKGRRLEAMGEVRSRVHPGSRGEETSDAEVVPIDASAESLDYSEDRGEVIYRGRVRIRQGDITTESPEATLMLGPDGRVVRAIAGQPVRLAQGARTANGDTATFDPARNVVHLVGDRVVLQDPDQHIEGKSLTFHVTDDTILVDGQDEQRTQTVFR